MDVRLERRHPGEIPYGALVLTMLTALPLGAWLVETGWLRFGQCGLKRLAHLPCMMCGSTRATLQLLEGDVMGALAFQPMMTGVYALIVLWGIVSVTTFLFDRTVRLDWNDRETRLLQGALIVVPVTNWIYLIAAGV